MFGLRSKRQRDRIWDARTGGLLKVRCRGRGSVFVAMIASLDNEHRPQSIRQGVLLHLLWLINEPGLNVLSFLQTKKPVATGHCSCVAGDQLTMNPSWDGQLMRLVLNFFRDEGESQAMHMQADISRRLFSTHSRASVIP